MSNNEATAPGASDDKVNQVEEFVMPAGHLPDFEGKPVLASCENCQWNLDQSDGPEYGSPWFACENETISHMSNLKGYPFKTAQKCCELHRMYTVDWAKVLREEQEKHQASLEA